MKTYNTLSKLLDDVENLIRGEWIYTNIYQWNSNPDKSKFHYIPWKYIQDLDDDEIYLDKEGMEMPKTVQADDLRCWMLVSSLAYIKNTMIKKDEDLDWVVSEINYYREHDTFSD